MSDKPKGRTVPIWVFVVTFIGVAVVAGLTGWFVANLRTAPVVPTTPVATTTTTVTTTVTVSTTPTPTAEPTTAPTPTPKPKPKTTKEWALLPGGFASDGRLFIKADYVYFYAAGTAANNAKTKYGGSLRPDGSYVRNTSSTIRTLVLKPTADIELIEWLETGTAGSSFKYGKADPNAFVAVLAGTATSPSGVWVPAGKAVLLTVTGTTVSEVKQYQPAQ